MDETPLGFGMAMIQCPEAMQYFEQDRNIDREWESQPNPELREYRHTLENELEQELVFPFGDNPQRYV